MGRLGSMRSLRRLTSAASGLALLLVLGSCADQEEPVTPEADSIYLPSATATPSEGATTMIDPPADYSTVEGAGFEISVPGEFRQERATSSNGEPLLLLELPSQVSAIPQRVAVIRDVAPSSSAAEQSFALETAKSAGGPDAEATRVQLPTEEGQAAFLVRWKEVRPSKGSANVEVTYWQLMQQVGDDLILNVVAFAPSEEFPTSEVSKILRTFVPTATSA